MATTSNELAVRVENEIQRFQQRAAAIVVRDQESCKEALAFVVEGRAKIKAVGFELDPGITKARETLDHLREQKKRWVERFETPTKQVEKLAEDWIAEERRKTAAEQERINAARRAEAQQKAELERKEAERQARLDRERREKELSEARKAGEIGKREEARLAKQAAEAEEAARALAAKQAAETATNVQTVRVAPSVPKVAGIRGRINYRFEVVDPSKVKTEWLMPNEVAIGAKVRADKDAKKSEAEIGGIRVWTEDSI